MTAPAHGIGRKMAKGAAWMVGFKLVERSIGMISTIILARILVPEDFGLIAMATAVIAILEVNMIKMEIAALLRAINTMPPANHWGHAIENQSTP